MAIVVQKYGGSSVADPARLGVVADRVAATVRAGKRVVVVVSAMGKSTDELYALAKQVTEAPPRRELDMLVSTGERISMALLAMALAARGVDAISFTGSQSGILTNDRHSGARIIDVRPVRIEDELERGKVVIVAGFQGMSYKREITTLGRGGSDTTAVALAAALGADCEIYSDIDGVYSADPRVVPSAEQLPHIGYDEMQALAEHGARVLNAQAVEWARRAGITIAARATTGSTKETVVSGHNRADGARVAVTGSTKLMRVVGGARSLDICAEEGLSVRDVRPGCIYLGLEDVPDWARIERRLIEDGDHGAQIATTGAVSLVGPGVNSAARVVAALTLARANNYEVIDFVVVPLRVTLYVPAAAVDDLCRALHDAGSS